jgi:hypothetical protein
VADIKPPPEPDKPFDKFKRLTGQLLQVPKKELDEKLAAHEREKVRRATEKKGRK